MNVPIRYLLLRLRAHIFDRGRTILEDGPETHCHIVTIHSESDSSLGGTHTFDYHKTTSWFFINELSMLFSLSNQHSNL